MLLPLLLLLLPLLLLLLAGMLLLLLPLPLQLCKLRCMSAIQRAHRSVVPMAQCRQLCSQAGGYGRRMRCTARGGQMAHVQDSVILQLHQSRVAKPHIQ